MLFNNNDDEEFSVTVWDPSALSCQGARCPARAFGRQLGEWLGAWLLPLSVMGEGWFQ